jgi:hypothetical protein
VASVSNASLAQGSISSTTAVNVSGMSVSLVVPVAGSYRFAVNIDSNSTSATDIVAIRISGLTPVIDWLSEANSSPATMGTTKSHSFEAVRSLAPGTYPLVLQALRAVGPGTITLNGTSGKPASLTVDRIS